MQLSEQELIRRDKLKTLREMGINPYPADLFPLDHTSKSIKENYEEGKKVIIAGRLMRKKIQGKASFAEIQDSEGRIQVYFNRDEICTGEDKTAYNDLFKKLLDLGDFIGVEGELFTTQVGEITVSVKEFKLLSKALKPLPLPSIQSQQYWQLMIVQYVKEKMQYFMQTLLQVQLTDGTMETQHSQLPL